MTKLLTSDQVERYARDGFVHPVAVLSRDEINSTLRHIEHDGLDRSIDMRISRLRKRLGDDAEQPVRIKTVRGQGYLFSRTDWN